MHQFLCSDLCTWIIPSCIFSLQIFCLLLWGNQLRILYISCAIYLQLSFFLSKHFYLIIFPFIHLALCSFHQLHFLLYFPQFLHFDMLFPLFSLLVKIVFFLSFPSPTIYSMGSASSIFIFFSFVSPVCVSVVWFSLMEVIASYIVF